MALFANDIDLKTRAADQPTPTLAYCTFVASAATTEMLAQSGHLALSAPSQIIGRFQYLKVTNSKHVQGYSPPCFILTCSFVLYFRLYDMLTCAPMLTFFVANMVIKKRHPWAVRALAPTDFFSLRFLKKTDSLWFRNTLDGHCKRCLLPPSTLPTKSKARRMNANVSTPSSSVLFLCLDSLLQQLAGEMLEGLVYLHDLGIVHGCLSPQLILLDSKVRNH
jgi:hypothetical protein